MKKINVITGIAATAITGVSIYILKKREENKFKKEYKELQENFKKKLQRVSEHL